MSHFSSLWLCIRAGPRSLLDCHGRAQRKTATSSTRALLISFPPDRWEKVHEVLTWFVIWAPAIAIQGMSKVLRTLWSLLPSCLMTYSSPLTLSFSRLTSVSS